MPYYDEYLPVPYLKVDSNFNIIGNSLEVLKYFEISRNKLTSLVDEGSVEKLYNNLFLSKDRRKIELNFLTKYETIELFDVFISFDYEDHCHMVLIPIGQKIEVLEDKLLGLQKRLLSTDFELYEKKEELESALERQNELSGPFIPLSQEMAFVPLFGDITGEKMRVLNPAIIKRAYEGSYQTILFDFTATGRFETHGIALLGELFQMLKIIGNGAIKIIGLNPNHAVQLNDSLTHWPVQYESTLKQVIKKVQLKQKNRQTRLSD
ncbi:hypothetical protein [Peribacillus kribbensis]|uniref:hypothetical protein n=1 Tax=Peribacillus kribbensis TaxID=356658 RepID=UPI00042A05C7|nr:hypothetical protein [Peribacillus kribbensis]